MTHDPSNPEYSHGSWSDSSAMCGYLGWGDAELTNSFAPIKGPYSTSSMNHKLQKAKDWLADRKVKKGACEALK